MVLVLDVIWPCAGCCFYDAPALCCHMVLVPITRSLADSKCVLILYCISRHDTDQNSDSDLTLDLALNVPSSLGQYMVRLLLCL